MNAMPIRVNDRAEAIRIVGQLIDNAPEFTGYLWVVLSDEGTVRAVTGCSAKAESNARRFAAIDEYIAARDAYEKATAQPRWHLKLSEENPIALRYRAARAALEGEN